MVLGRAEDTGQEYTDLLENVADLGWYLAHRVIGACIMGQRRYAALLLVSGKAHSDAPDSLWRDRYAAAAPRRQVYSRRRFEQQD